MGHVARTTVQPVTLESLDAKLDALSDLIQRVVLPTLPQRSSLSAELSAEQAASLVGRSPQTVRTWCRRHKLGFRSGKEWRIPENDLRAYFVGRFGEAKLPAALALRSPTKVSPL